MEVNFTVIVTHLIWYVGQSVHKLNLDKGFNKFRQQPPLPAGLCARPVIPVIMTGEIEK